MLALSNSCGNLFANRQTSGLVWMTHITVIHFQVQTRKYNESMREYKLQICAEMGKKETSDNFPIKGCLNYISNYYPEIIS